MSVALLTVKASVPPFSPADEESIELLLLGPNEGKVAEFWFDKPVDTAQIKFTVASYEVP